MKISNTNLKATIKYALIIIISFFFTVNSHGQQEPVTCKAELTRYNNEKTFPEPKEDDYRDCLAKIETYFYSIDPLISKNIEKINTLNDNLKSKNNLSSRKVTKTDSINYYTLLRTTNE